MGRDYAHGRAKGVDKNVIPLDPVSRTTQTEPRSDHPRSPNRNDRVEETHFELEGGACSLRPCLRPAQILLDSELGGWSGCLEMGVGGMARLLQLQFSSTCERTRHDPQSSRCHEA